MEDTNTLLDSIEEAAEEKAEEEVVENNEKRETLMIIDPDGEHTGAIYSNRDQALLSLYLSQKLARRASSAAESVFGKREVVINDIEELHLTSQAFQLLAQTLSKRLTEKFEVQTISRGDFEVMMDKLKQK